MAISETKMQIVIANYFKDECDVNTSIKQAFEKGFRIGVKKGANTNRPQGEWIEKIVDNVKITVCSNCDKEPTFTHYYGSCGNYSLSDFCPNCGADMRGVE